MQLQLLKGVAENSRRMPVAVISDSARNWLTGWVSVVARFARVARGTSEAGKALAGAALNKVPLDRARVVAAALTRVARDRSTRRVAVISNVAPIANVTGEPRGA